ncbi:F420-0--gamma-glutamyl ligase [Candidatus Dojkabacteria bacterium]|uniref:F420-0--gamma-glutamyl ligase n=1 Tax=Candidatus Dojkabacteria bacterium TaxID=2099670 RepID=A0A847D1G0_9BACT|nr:F420-0--gamma-glutamyl ligase [Candidatus Dojkabacteria bacterium]
MRNIGTSVYGIRTPIIKEGDDLIQIVVDSVLKAIKNHKIEIKNRDVIGITEAVVSICQHNYVTLENIVKEIQNKYGDKEIGLIFPILSRNRFSMILKAATMACENVHILFSYPSDEVGNHIIDPKMVEESRVNPYSDSFGEKKFRKLFGYSFKHEFTGIDYIEYYKSFGERVKVYFSNNPKYILKFTRNVLCCDIHTRNITKKKMIEGGANVVFGLDDICSRKNSKTGYNKDYGLLGSNKTGENRLKLFPRDGQEIVEAIQKQIKKITGKKVEVMIYGDGAFKDPVGQIWELADPVVSPFFTKGLLGRPKEVKLKYISENWDKKGILEEYVKKLIVEKNSSKYQVEKSFGTTPRQLTDLLGSLCDLTSGSGDKGTPVVLIQGYFDDYTVE